MIFEENVIMSRIEKQDVKCKCGSIRYNVEVFPDDNGRHLWLMVTCRACGNILYYNGA